MSILPTDVFHLIMDYTYSLKISYATLMRDIIKVEQIRDSIHDTFLTVSCFDFHLQQFIHNPYRNFGPYHCTLTIQPQTLISNSILCIAQTLKSEFFERVKSYRSVFLRFCLKFQQGKLLFFNKLLERYLIFYSTTWPRAIYQGISNHFSTGGVWSELSGICFASLACFSKNSVLLLFQLDFFARAKFYSRCS